MCASRRCLCIPAALKPHAAAGSAEKESLELLWLHDNQLTSIVGVDECPKLQKLHLGKNQIGGSLQALSRCSTLVEAHLHDNSFSSDLDSLRSCSKLTHLNLERNELKMTDDDVDSWRRSVCDVNFKGQRSE